MKIRKNKVTLSLLSKAYISELRAFRAYLHAVVSVTGPLHDVYESVFKKFMDRELHHLYEIGEKITAMGGVVPTECKPFDDLSDAINTGYVDTLKVLQQYEDDTLSLYEQIRRYAESIGDSPLVLLIEEIILEEEEHHDELERILLSDINGSRTIEKVIHDEDTNVVARTRRQDLLIKNDIL